MSTEGDFHEEEVDIVCLKPADGCECRTGWINIGAHALRLKLDEQGNLEVEAFARTMERDPLATLKVSAEQAKAAGGCDPDAGGEA